MDRRLSWLLAFRVVVAAVLLLMTLAADLSDWPLRRISEALYAAGIGTLATVAALGIAIRRQVSPTLVATLHLVAALLTAVVVVEVTGVVVSPFPFLYILAILDSALVGGRRIALLVASAATILFGLQLSLQLYGLWPTVGGWSTEPADYVGAFIVHGFAFFLTAWLVGQLSLLLRSADEAASRARSSLRDVRALHGAVLASLPIGVLTLEPAGRVRLLSSATAQILGASMDVSHLDELPDSIRALLVSSGAPHEMSVDIQGRTRVLALWRTALRTRDSAGSELGTGIDLLLVEDRTETRALEASLREKERLASLGELAAGIAHEIRNPLAAISGSFELLLGEARDAGAQHKLESVVRREIARLARLVDDFLLYARPPRIDLEMTDVVALVREVHAVVAQDAAMGQRAMQLDLPSTLLARIDAAQVRQVLWNLIRNAADASQDGDGLVLRAASTTEQGTEVVRLEVEDHGRGVPSEMRPHLFEPFRTTKTKGTGLGLAVVRRIVHAHGGEVVLEDVVGGGTRAVVVLPRG